MTDDRLKDYHEKKNKIADQGKTISEIIEITQNNIQIESKTVGELKKFENYYSYMDRMLDDVPESQIVQMDDGEYSTLTTPVLSAGISGEIFYDMLDQSRQSERQHEQHYSSCASINSIGISGTSGYKSLSETNPSWFPNGQQISKDYRIQDSLYEQIDYIKTCLSKHLPHVAKDFKVFIDKFNAFKLDSSQYQDLIGSRTMFFFKMIFDFSKQHFGVEYPRKKAIEVFVYGNGTPLPLSDPIIRSCHQLYTDLSSQNAGAQSVKIGNVTPQYVESTFRRLIGEIASVLKLREQQYTP